jgi:hypothetical protein
LFLADGCFAKYNVVIFSSSDKQLMDDLVAMTEYKNCISKSIRKNRPKSKPMYTIGYSGPIVKKFLELGFSPGYKTDKLFIPSEVSDQTFRHFLRGFIDGDGCFSTNTANKGNNTYLELNICSLCYPFLAEIHNRLLTMEKVSHGKIKKGRRVYHLRFGHYDAISVGNFVYYNSTIKLDRKYLKCKERAV